MSRDLERIGRVIDAFERSDWAEIDVRVGDVRVHLVAGGQHPGAERPIESSDVPTPVTSPDTPLVAPTAAAAATPEGAHLVVSPSPGIFWRSPEPGAPPFADLGERVDAAATVCIVEVMKLMNHIKAGVDGEVVAVFGENGVAVQQGEALFAIAPAGSAT